MKEVMRTRNLVAMSLARDILAAGDIESFIFDEHTGSLYPPLGALEPRLMVSDDDYNRAVAALKKLHSDMKGNDAAC